MQAVRFHFLASDGTNLGNTADARLAATILANCLSRQGYRGQAAGNTVLATLPDHSEQDPGQVFVVLNEAALPSLEQIEPVDRRSAIIVCSARPARVLQKQLGRLFAGVVTVDAEGIAEEEGSDPVLAMLGGAARMVSFIDLDALSAAIWSAYDRELPYAARAAVRTLDLGYMQAQQVPAIFAQ
jgi:Pyruvate/2-oxoacid:ferredoxin oxidoreductase gamma subunit